MYIKLIIQFKAIKQQVMAYPVMADELFILKLVITIYGI
jgi:hypothetical protein